MARSFRILFFHIQTVYQIHAQIARAAAGLFCGVFPFPGTWLRDIRFFTQTASIPIDGDLVFQADGVPHCPGWSVEILRIGHRKHIKISDTVLCVGKRKIEIFDISGKSTGNISGIRDAAQEGSDLRLFCARRPSLHAYQDIHGK